MAIFKDLSMNSRFEAYQNALEHIASNAGENLSAAESRIRDVDMANEMMKLQKNNILQQTAQAMLAQAKNSRKNVLRLLH